MIDTTYAHNSDGYLDAHLAAVYCVNKSTADNVDGRTVYTALLWYQMVSLVTPCGQSARQQVL